MIPLVPSETMVIIGGVAAGSGDQFLGFVILAGALGAFAGDNLAYQLGRSCEDWLQRTVFRTESGKQKLEWATRQLDIRGGMLLVTARFIRAAAPPSPSPAASRTSRASASCCRTRWR